MAESNANATEAVPESSELEPEPKDMAADAPKSESMPKDETPLEDASPELKKEDASAATESQSDDGNSFSEEGDNDFDEDDEDDEDDYDVEDDDDNIVLFFLLQNALDTKPIEPS